MIFVDTSAFYALLDAADDAHSAASKAWKRISGERLPLHTTNYIAVETGSILQARLGLEAARDFYNNLLPLCEMHLIDAAGHEAAVQLVLAENKRGLSLVDCSSFVTMRRNGIRRAFAFDEDFRRFGFELEAVR